MGRNTTRQLSGPNKDSLAALGTAAWRAAGVIKVFADQMAADMQRARLMRVGIGDRWHAAVSDARCMSREGAGSFTYCLEWVVSGEIDTACGGVTERSLRLKLWRMRKRCEILGRYL